MDTGAMPCEKPTDAVGAGGEPLGVTAVVLLTVRVPGSEYVQEVPCYVLDSSEWRDQQLWHGSWN